MLLSQAAVMKLLVAWMGQTASSCYKPLQKSGLPLKAEMWQARISTFVIFCYLKWWPPNCCDCIPVTSRQRASLHHYQFQLIHSATTRSRSCLALGLTGHVHWLILQRWQINGATGRLWGCSWLGCIPQQKKAPHFRHLWRDFQLKPLVTLQNLVQLMFSASQLFLPKP